MATSSILYPARTDTSFTVFSISSSDSSDIVDANAIASAGFSIIADNPYAAPLIPTKPCVMVLRYPVVAYCNVIKLLCVFNICSLKKEKPLLNVSKGKPIKALDKSLTTEAVVLNTVPVVETTECNLLKPVEVLFKLLLAVLSAVLTLPVVTRNCSNCVFTDCITIEALSIATIFIFTS